MKSVSIIAFLFFFSSSYSQSALQMTDLALSPAEASTLSDQIKQAKHDKHKFIELVSMGQALCMSQRYAESNEYFERAYLLREDQHVRGIKSKYESYGDVHELFMVLYFKAINYLAMNDIPNARVEGKRIVELMRPLNRDDIDRRLIATDPLAQSLVGLLYSLNREYDDAALAFKSAETLLEREYDGLSSKAVPQWVIDAAIEMRNNAETENAGFVKSQNAAGHLIFIWHNGEFPMNHLHEDFKVRRDGERFVSNDINVAIGEDGFGNYWLPFIEQKEPIFSTGVLRRDGVPQRLEVVSYISWFSMRADKARLEQTGRHIWHRGINWATLPSQISWAIVPLAPGNNQFDFKMVSGKEFRSVNFDVQGDHKTHVYLLTTLESKTDKVPQGLTPVTYWTGQESATAELIQHR